VAILNPFANDAFSFISLTDAIQIIPNRYGLLNQLGLFRDVGVRTRTALVERRLGVLNLLPSQPVGAPPTVGKGPLRDVVPFAIPHIPHMDVVLPEEVQGLRAFGSENELETMANIMLNKLENMRAKHAITLEYLKWGALNGIVMDGDGTTVLTNLYTAWGLTQHTQTIPFSSSTANIQAAITTLVRYFEDNLKGETMTGVMVFTSAGFWDAFLGNVNIRNAYQFWMGTQDMNPLRNDVRQGFTFEGVTFREFRGHASTFSGTDIPFIAANTAIAIPLGTTNMFQTLYAPAAFSETVNTIGLPLYAKQEERKFQTGWDIWTEANPLPMNLRPDLAAVLMIS
jgi:hypothetical protein